MKIRRKRSGKIVVTFDNDTESITLAEAANVSWVRMRNDFNQIELANRPPKWGSEDAVALGTYMTALGQFYNDVMYLVENPTQERY